MNSGSALLVSLLVASQPCQRGIRRGSECLGHPLLRRFEA